MIEESTAFDLIRETTPPCARSEQCPLSASLGRLVAATVVAKLPVPRFANAMVDGYALPEGRHGEGTTFEVIGEQPAGVDRGFELRAGEAVRIFTGAPLPSGTTAVVMQEDVVDTGRGRIRLAEAIREGEGVREQGDDLCVGQQLLEPGDRLTPAAVALLASQGMASVTVRPWPRVQVLSTGDELKPVGAPLQPGELYESNGLMLCLLGETLGWPGWQQRHLMDDPASLRAAIAEAADVNDFLILSGGVSVGDHDHVRSVLTALGFEEHFWRVRVQPGKPVLFGTLGECQVFGLPGNPVSSFVSFHLFVASAIRQWLGQAPQIRVQATLKRSVENRGNRPHYVRGLWDREKQSFVAVGLQRSHGMLGLSKANALARLPETSVLDAGDEVEVLPFGLG